MFIELYIMYPACGWLQQLYFSINLHLAAFYYNNSSEAKIKS